MNFADLLSFFILFSVLISILFGAYFYAKMNAKYKTDFALKWFLLSVFIHVLYVICSRYIFLNDLFLDEAPLFCLLYLPFYWHALSLSQNKPIKYKYFSLWFIPSSLLWMFFFILYSNEAMSMEYYIVFINSLYGVFASLLMCCGIFGYLILFRGKNKVDDVRFKQLSAISSLIMIVVSALFLSKLFQNDDNVGISAFNANLFVDLLLLVFVLSINRMWFYRYIDEKEKEREKVDVSDQLDKYYKSKIKQIDLEASLKALEELDIVAYLDIDLNLEKLSTQLRISKYELSQVFSIGLDTSFTKFVNMKRCEYASELLLNRKETNTSIEDIGFESGFNSNTTFYRAFKDNYGVPPSKFA